MMVRLSDVKITVMAWSPLPPHGIRPPETQCLFSDGRNFMVGVYQGDKILMTIPAMGAVTFYICPEMRRLLRWTKLNNLTKVFT